ncbi:alcohol dehydrogenase [Tsuneonella sp. CC-YZS046]|uniref:alcohol dehydrogenase n=1 Tax=Tsuneonella sp. CC-YZS046 TaxID=3042152 RepID=UPI002D786077|nr:alcohol dehydrogenase [Tsuneonella sp. CC-YZS046]WRO66438.1 alcohol dehydrogenase [Tsuneonella sp. CC-YZS046]
MRRWSVVENNKPLQAIEFPDLVPEGEEILLEVTHCGVCHSDLHFVKGEFDLGGGQILRITDRGVKLPCAPGHEIVGRVVGLGPQAKGAKVGDHRLIYPWIGCGKCHYCTTDQENLCLQSRSLGIIRDGGFGSHVTVPNASYLFDFDGIDPALAATFACSGLTVYSAIRKLNPASPSAPILIMGAGGLGHAAMATLQALGHTRLLVVDISEEKRQAAVAAGAERAFAPDEPDVLAKIAEQAGEPLIYAIDFVNIRATVSLALDSLAKTGRLVLVGVGGGDYPLSLAGMIFKPRSIVGSITGSRQELREVLELARSGKLQPVPIRCLPKDSANEALDLLEEGKVTGRLVLEGA